MKNIFKNLSYLAMLTLIVTGFSGCTTKTDNSEYVSALANTYYLTDISVAGYEATDLWGFYQVIELSADGTHSITSFDNGDYYAVTGDFEATEDTVTMYSDQDPEWSEVYNYSFVENVLTLQTTDEQETYVFGVDSDPMTLSNIINYYEFDTSTINGEVVVDAPDYYQLLILDTDNIFNIYTTEDGVDYQNEGTYSVVGNLLFMMFNSNTSSIQVYEYEVSSTQLILNYYRQGNHYTYEYSVYLS
ncbi:MAG: hypothetical protein AB7S44_01990 [Spirochaetales bacterium]